MAITVQSLVPQAPAAPAAPGVPAGGLPASLQPYGLAAWQAPPSAPSPYGAQYMGYSPLAQPPPATQGHSIGGLLKNVLSNASQFASGIGSMIGGAYHDLTKVAEEAISGGKLNDSPWYTAQFVRQAPDILKFYKDYYGPLLPGGAPASQFLENVYKQPIQVVLDAFSASAVASRGVVAAGNMLGGSAASQAFLEAGKEMAAGNFARQGELNALANRSLQNIPQWIRALEPGVGRTYPGGEYKMLVGEKPIALPYSPSILRRELIQKPLRYFATEPLANLEKAIADLEARKTPLPTQDEGIRAKWFEPDALQHRYELAKRYELPRIERTNGVWSSIYNARLRWGVNEIASKHQMAYMTGRAEWNRDANLLAKAHGLTDAFARAKAMFMSLGEPDLKKVGMDSIDPTVNPEAHAGIPLTQEAARRFDPVDPATLKRGDKVRYSEKGGKNPWVEGDVTVVGGLGTSGKRGFIVKRADGATRFLGNDAVDVQRFNPAAVPREVPVAPPVPRPAKDDLEDRYMEAMRADDTAEMDRIAEQMQARKRGEAPAEAVPTTTGETTVAPAAAAAATPEDALYASLFPEGVPAARGEEPPIETREPPPEEGPPRELTPDEALYQSLFEGQPTKGGKAGGRPTKPTKEPGRYGGNGRRVLFTGGRDWQNEAMVAEVINSLPENAVVIVGGAPGLDTIAEDLARARGLAIERYPAQWRQYKGAAGPIRNTQMLKEGKPDEVYAFHDNLSGKPRTMRHDDGRVMKDPVTGRVLVVKHSAGTKNMITQANDAGLRVTWRRNGLPDMDLAPLVKRKVEPARLTADSPSPVAEWKDRDLEVKKNDIIGTIQYYEQTPEGRALVLEKATAKKAAKETGGEARGPYSLNRPPSKYEEKTPIERARERLGEPERYVPFAEEESLGRLYMAIREAEDLPDLLKVIHEKFGVHEAAGLLRDAEAQTYKTAGRIRRQTTRSLVDALNDQNPETWEGAEFGRRATIQKEPEEKWGGAALEWSDQDRATAARLVGKPPSARKFKEGQLDPDFLAAKAEWTQKVNAMLRDRPPYPGPYPKPDALNRFRRRVYPKGTEDLQFKKDQKRWHERNEKYEAGGGKEWDAASAAVLKERNAAISRSLGARMVRSGPWWPKDYPARQWLLPVPKLGEVGLFPESLEESRLLYAPKSETKMLPGSMTFEPGSKGERDWASLEGNDYGNAKDIPKDVSGGSKARTWKLMEWMRNQMRDVTHIPDDMASAWNLPEGTSPFNLDETHSEALLRSLYPEEADALLQAARDTAHDYGMTSTKGMNEGAVAQWQGTLPERYRQQLGANVNPEWEPIVPKHSGDAQRALFAKVMVDSGISEVWNGLIQMNQRFIEGVVKKWQRNNKGAFDREASDTELMNQAVITMSESMRSYRMFNAEGEPNSLHGFAAVNIDRALTKYAKENMQFINMPRYLENLNPRYAEAKRTLSEKLQREPTMVEIAQEMGLDWNKQADQNLLGDLMKYQSYARFTDFLDTPRATMEEGESIAENIAAPDVSNRAATSEEVLRKALAPKGGGIGEFLKYMDRSMGVQALSTLSAKDQMYLGLKLNDKLTQADLAKSLNMTRERVGLEYHDALERAKAHLAAEGIGSWGEVQARLKRNDAKIRAARKLGGEPLTETYKGQGMEGSAFSVKGTRVYYDVGGKKSFVGHVPNYLSTDEYLSLAQDAVERDVVAAWDRHFLREKTYHPDQPWLTSREVWADAVVNKGLRADLTEPQQVMVNDHNRRRAMADHEAAVEVASKAKEPIPYYVAKDYPQLPEYPRAVAQQEFLDATGITRWGQRESGNFHWTDITPADAFAALAVYDKVAESAVRMAPDLYPDVASFYQAVHHQMGDRGFYQDQIASTRGLSEPTALETAKGMKGLTARKTSKGTGYSTGVVPALRGEKVMVSLFPKSFGYEAADLHTALHEWGHVIAGFLPEELRTQMVRAYGGEEAVRFNAPRAGAAPIWTSQMHEQFADDFVKYLVDGHMPDNPALHTPFNIIKDTMRRIWNRLRSYAQEPLRADVKQVFDRIFNVDAQPTINEKVWAAGFNSMEEARHAAARITLGQGLTKDSNEMGQLRKLKPSERADLLSTYPAREKPLPTDTPTMLNDIYDRGHSSDVPPEPDPSNLHVPYEQQLAGRGFAVPQVAKTGSIDPTTVFQAATPGSLNGLRDKVRAMFEPMSSKLTPSVARRKGNPATGWTEIGVDSEGKRVARDIWDDQPQAHAVTDVRIGDFKQIPNVADMLRQLGDVVDVHDYLGRTNNAGYRGFHIDVRTPEGHIVQFRIHTPDSYRAARAAAPYAQQLSDHQGQLQRFRNDLAQGKELTVEQGELYAALSKNLPEETAWVRSVFEPVVHQLRESIDGEMMTPTEKYVEGLRLLTLERITNQLWERTYKKYDNGMVTLFRRQYLPLKMASGAKWVERDAEGALVRDFVGGTDEMMLHNQRQATMQRTPIYFPFQRIYDIKPSDFALPKGGNMVTRSAGKYLKPVKGYLLSNGQYVVDPTQVFARRASQALRMAEAWDMAKEITETYGRPLFDEDGKKVSDFSRASEMLWSPQNMLRFFNQQIHLTDFLDHSLSGLAETDEALKEALDVVMPYAEGHVKEMLSATTKGARLYAIPKVVGSQLNKMVQRDFLVGRGVRLFWTKPSNVWRSAVLSLSPRWIVNNVVGNTVFTALQAGPVGLANTIRAATPRFKKMVEDLHEAGTEVFTPNVNQGFFHETGEQYRIQSGDAGINSMIEDISQRMAASKPVRGLAAVGNWVQNFNSAIESAYRQGSFLTEAEKSYALRSGTSVLKAFMSSKNDLEEMFTKGLRPQDIKRAEAGMNYWMNDYSKMSPLVRNYVKPFLFPFWSFYRHVGKLLLTMPLEHPVSANIGKQLTDVSNELTQGYGALPDFLRGGVVWGPSDTPGSTKFLSTTGPNPFNAVFQTPMSLLHPAIKTAMEQITGRTAYSNFSKHFTSPDVISPFGSENQYKVDAQGNVSQLSRGATPGIFEELLSQFPQYQTAKDVVAGGQYYSTSSLLDILKSRLQGYPNAGAVITDPANPGVPQYPFSLPEKLLKQTGISTLDYTVPPYQQSLATESSAAILEYLRRLGIAPPAGQQAAAAATTPGITYMG